MGLYVSSIILMELDSPAKPETPPKKVRIVRRTRREARAVRPRGIAKPQPATRRKELGIECAWDEERQLYSPRRLFAHWRKSGLLEVWTRMGDIKDHTDPYLLRIINMPEFLLDSFRVWWRAQTDEEYMIIVPWDDMNRWLRRNGFTGRVSAAGSDWSP